jgi:uncharacterized protein (TIGR00730 family)
MTAPENTIRSVCVYCGSQPGRDSHYLEAAEILGRSIAEHGLRLVYGGGTQGLMGTVGRAVKAHGGGVTGIIPEFLFGRENVQRDSAFIDDLIVTGDMHERKHKMFERADAFVTLPGGIGTLEEIVEIMTWGQLGRHRKPMVLANVNGFWDPLSGLIAHMRAEGFIHTGHLVRPLIVSDPAEIVPAILRAASARDREGDSEVIARM